MEEHFVTLEVPSISALVGLVEVPGVDEDIERGHQVLDLQRQDLEVKALLGFDGVSLSFLQQREEEGVDVLLHQLEVKVDAVRGLVAEAPHHNYGNRLACSSWEQLSLKF